MKIALCQQEIIFENKIKNIEKICEFSEKAKKMGGDIVFFPEMSFTGFSMNIENTSEKDFKNIDIIKNIAFKNSVYIGFGWVKPSGGKAENHYTVISPEGVIICDYIKIHPFSYAGEDKFFMGGNKVEFFNINGAEFSVFICYDLRFPEIFQAVSYKSEIIIVAANWPEKRKEHWKTLLKARAIENQCYVAGVNCFGRQGDIYYSGDSCVYSPNGEIICSLKSGEDIIVFDFCNDTKKYREEFPLKNDRRTDLYEKYYKGFFK